MLPGQMVLALALLLGLVASGEASVAGELYQGELHARLRADEFYLADGRTTAFRLRGFRIVPGGLRTVAEGRHVFCASTERVINEAEQAVIEVDCSLGNGTNLGNFLWSAGVATPDCLSLELTPEKCLRRFPVVFR